jgi:hypothetical protein
MPLSSVTAQEPQPSCCACSTTQCTDCHQHNLPNCRKQNVQGYVALAPPFGGSTYAIANKLGGSRINLLQVLGDLLQPVLNEIMYHGSRGMPSMLMLMPYVGIWGKEHVSGDVATAAAATTAQVLGRRQRQQQHAVCWDRT